jgi:hypothetical protein
LAGSDTGLGHNLEGAHDFIAPGWPARPAGGLCRQRVIGSNGAISGLVGDQPTSSIFKVRSAGGLNDPMNKGI